MNETEFATIETVARLVNFGDGCFCRTKGEYCGEEGALWDYHYEHKLWNPYTSDEDAFSVMILLGLAVEVDYQCGQVYARKDGVLLMNTFALHTTLDQMRAATRRCITDAAKILVEES